MKKFTLMLVAGLFALAGSVQAQGNVLISAENTAFGEDGTADLVLKIACPTSETLVGYNFSLSLPDGVKGANAKTGKETSTGKVTTASVTLNNDIHPLLWSDDDEDYTVDPKTQLQLKDKTDGGYLFIWIDQAKKIPLKANEGVLLTIKLTKAEGFTSGNAKIYDIALSNAASVGIAGDDVPFVIGDAESGINDIQSADATAPAYNLQGIRVNNAKGLIIRDGKKMVVK